MKKEFTRKNKKIQFILVSACGVFTYLFYGSALITENFLSQGMIYKTINIIILLLIFIFLLYAILDLNRKITINDSGIIIKKVFKNIEIKWSEIIEFKKQEKGVGAWAGWKYSLKYERNDEKHIMFADNNIENLQELIDSIFKLAVVAKFMEIRNEAFLPFFKNYKTSEWENN